MTVDPETRLIADAAVLERLTPQQRKCLATLATLAADNGYVPSMRELAAAMGRSSTSTVEHLLRMLQEAGVIRTVPRRARAIQLVGVHVLPAVPATVEEVPRRA